MLKGKIKYFFLKFSGKYSYFKKGVKCKSKWYGNTYGGFYAHPNILNENSVVYSFGIGEDISFDRAIIEKHDCKIFGFDPTPKSVSWVNKQNLPENFHFLEYGVSNESGFADFYLPKNPEYVSGSIITQSNINVNEKIVVQMKTIQDIMKELGHNHIDILKMDIEGEEYDVIENILDNKVSVSQILIEFHDRFFKDGRDRSYNAIKNLNKSGFEVFAVADSFEEVSFINKNILVAKNSA
jgi:FkbM family methyltransferase